ncbi:MAG TPA: hypothetical protein PLQ21_08995 [Candidatus Kapabacteria bacterium]|nr:hypothetical protein [Candidatus Kapabacteria bacterium]
MVKIKNNIYIVLTALLFVSCSQETIEIPSYLTADIPMAIGGSVDELRRQGFKHEDTFTFSFFETSLYKDFGDAIAEYSIVVTFDESINDNYVKTIYVKSRYHASIDTSQNVEFLKKLRLNLGDEDYYNSQKQDTVYHEWNTIHGWYIDNADYCIEVTFLVDTLLNQRVIDKGYNVTIYKPEIKKKNIKDRVTRQLFR